MTKLLLWAALLLTGAFHYALVFCGGLFVIDHFGWQSLSRPAGFSLVAVLGLLALVYPLLFLRSAILQTPGDRRRNR